MQTSARLGLMATIMTACFHPLKRGSSRELHRERGTSRPVAQSHLQDDLPYACVGAD